MNAIRRSTPKSFHCSSGRLLWGQLYQICHAFASQNALCDGPPGSATAAHPERLTGGTIMQNVYQYRVKAKVGNWKVGKVSVMLDQPFHVGYIAYHESADPLAMCYRAQNVGLSNSNDHDDANIRYINRYDWAWHWGGRNATEDAARVLTEASNIKIEESVEPWKAQRFMLVDDDPEVVRGFLSGIAGVMNDLVEDGPYLSENFSVGDPPRAIQLRIDDTEYEFGWQIFDDNEECIGFVYDGAYSVLGQEENAEIQVET